MELDEKESKRIDVVKGYVGKSGDFCGLLFRRDSDWESNVFGHRSAYELTFELMEGERFRSIFFHLPNRLPSRTRYSHLCRPFTLDVLPLRPLTQCC